MISIFNDCTKDSKLNKLTASGYTDDIREEVGSILDALQELLIKINKMDCKRFKYEKYKNL